ncbi:MAG: ATP-binding protein [Roseiflexaceae bacterium]
MNPSADPSHVAPARAHRYGWVALLIAGPLFLLILKLFPSLNQPVLHSPLVHILIAGGASALGIGLALFVLRVAIRAQDGRIYLVGIGFLSTASIFLIHAISTPNVLMSGRGLATAWSAPLSLSLGAFFFALSGLELSAALNRRLLRYARMGLLAYLICWLVYSLIFLVLIPAAAVAALADSAYHTISATHDAADVSTSPAAIYQGDAGDDGVRQDQDRSANAQPALDLSEYLRIILVALGLVCAIFAAYRHGRLYRRSPSTVGLAILCGIVLFGEALLTQQLSEVYSASFWLYHAEEFVGFGVISYAGLVAYRQGQSRVGLFESLFLAPTRDRIQAAYAQGMEALVELLARGEEPPPAQLHYLRTQFAMTETQVRVLERAAFAVAHERRQRRELERLNAVLHQLEQNKEQLMQMIVHDLKNPLTALIGFLEILRMDGGLSTDQQQLLNGALRSSKNLSGLISDLLDIGRIEEGRLDLDYSTLAPRELLTDCAAEMSAWLLQDGKTIQIEADADLPPLRADPRLMRRVLLNLLSNAIKHTPAGIQITLRACPTTEPMDAASGVPASLVIEVGDTGPGIAPEHLDYIFEKFGRVNGAHHLRQGSTGLGLTFCRLAVEAHGGTIGVTSIIGQGTTFRVTLPMV